MIRFRKKVDSRMPAVTSEENRFDRIRKEAAEQHKKADTDGKRRRDSQTAEDNRLI